jgi:transporter family-2 protein
MSRAVAVISALLAGGIVGLQPPANAALAKHVSDIGAALVSITISLILIGITLLVAGSPGKLSGLSAFKPEYALGGIAGATIVLVSLIAVRSLGVGGLTALLVAAQLAIGLIADRYRWFGIHHAGLSAGRIAGFLLVVGGTVLINRT